MLPFVFFFSSFMFLCARASVCVCVYFSRKLQFLNFSETALVEVLLGSASFEASLKPLLVMDYTQTLLGNPYKAVGTLP